MPKSLRVLLVPWAMDLGPYTSLVRVGQAVRETLERNFELVELGIDPRRQPEDYLAAFAAAQPIDAVVDLSNQALHGPGAGHTPTLFLALGSLPNGATLPWLRRSRLKTTDVFLVNCTSDQAIHEQTHRGAGPRAELLPFGIDTALFRPRPELRASARHQLGLDRNAFVLISAGRLNVQKNLHSLLLLLRELAAREPRVHLILAGEADRIDYPLFGVTNEGYEQQLDQDIRRWGLEDRVTKLGRLDDDDLIAAHAAADAFVSLTLHNNENFGYAPVEAMACATPVVGSHFGGLKDTIVHGTTGFHVETVMTDHGLRAAWRQAVGPLLRLSADPDLTRRMGAAARQRAVEHYGLDVFDRRLTAIIRDAARIACDQPVVGGARFEFAPEASRHHLRALYRNWRRAEPAGRTPAAASGLEYDSYRWFQGPYATRDVHQVVVTDDEPLALVTRCQLDRAASLLRSLDPIWPRSYPLEPAELATVAALEPGTSLDDLIARGANCGLDASRVRALVSRLLRDGVVLPDRPFRPAVAPLP